MDRVRRGEIRLGDPAREEGLEGSVSVFDVLAREDVDETRRCPSCGERIQLIARRCRFCAADLEPGALVPSPPPPPPPPLAVAPPAPAPPHPVPPAPPPPRDLGRDLLQLPILGVLVTVYLALSLEPAVALRVRPFLVDLPVILGTAVVAAVEARRLGLVADRRKGAYGPAGWFWFLVLLWVVGYPAYFRQRRKHGRPDRFVASLLLVVVHVAVGVGASLAWQAAAERWERALAQGRAAEAEREAERLEAQREAERLEKERREAARAAEEELRKAEAIDDAGFDVTVGCSIAGTPVPAVSCLMESGIHVVTDEGGQTIDALTLAGTTGSYEFHVPRYFSITMMNTADTPVMQLSVEIRDRTGKRRFRDSKGAGGVIDVGNHR